MFPLFDSEKTAAKSNLYEQAALDYSIFSQNAMTIPLIMLLGSNKKHGMNRK